MSQATRRSFHAGHLVTGGPDTVSDRLFCAGLSSVDAYSDVEYLDLMDRFKKEGLPFSVAVMDMDW